MTEIITRPQADFFVNLVLAAGVLLAIAGVFWAKRRNQSMIWNALLWGGPCVLAFVLWHIYNAITDKFGLDSVLNLAVNAALFVIVGSVCGFVWARFAPHRDDAAADAAEGME